MTFGEFKNTLDGSLPKDLSIYLESLWYDGKGDWAKSHNTIQDIEDKNAAWIHAYLHRKEGDTGNAGYWYNKAGRKAPAVSLEEEWIALVKAFL